MSKKAKPHTSFKTLTALADHGLVRAQDLPALESVVENFSVGISGQMQQLINSADQQDPIAKQFIPSTEELNIADIERTDPIGDESFTAVPGLIHRYPDRCLLTPVHVCPVYCRFCFRKEKLGPNSATMSREELEAAYAYIEAHPEIWEVILTGGDPLILKPAVLKKIIDRLNIINHVDIIRIHTRVPVVESFRIDDDMIAVLKGSKPVYVALHANHPNEFTPEAVRAIAALVDAGIPMISQSTLLKDVNDNIETLSALMRCFIKNRIKPYYLHQGDLVRGTAHFRTTIEKGQMLMKQLRGRFSGLCQPVYVLDIPGGHGKMPIGPNYLTKEHECHYQIEDYQGNVHAYPPIK